MMKSVEVERKKSRLHHNASWIRNQKTTDSNSLVIQMEYFGKMTYYWKYEYSWQTVILAKNMWRFVRTEIKNLIIRTTKVPNFFSWHYFRSFWKMAITLIGPALASVWHTNIIEWRWAFCSVVSGQSKNA